MSELDPDAFPLRRASVRGVDLAYVRAGEGGVPLLLLHGWPETMRIWWRNIGPLADAGFDVIVPDLRGFGESGPAPDDFYDVVAQELAARFDEFVVRQVLFNTIPPVGLGDAYEAAGVPVKPDARARPASDYFFRQANYADVVASELDTPDKRRRYVATFYGPRFWASPGSFDQDAIRFMVEPYGDEVSFRSSLAIYESALGQRPVSESPAWIAAQTDTPTLILYGPDDHVIPTTFPAQAAVAFPEHVGPFIVQDAGHFLQWEQPRVLNQAVRYFCLDLLGDSRRDG